MFYCDPPGRSDPESLMNNGSSVTDINYIMFHDQEPIHLDIHTDLFESAYRRNKDLNYNNGTNHSGLIVSEKDSEFVEQVCSQYDMTPYYYFFHGWAALDWYRGYNRSYLMPLPSQRTITKSFISPNRIIGGKRRHRVDLMYQLLQRGISDAWISFPKVCPAENVHINEIATEEQRNTFASANLPWNFPNEENHPMHSCWLSLFDESAESAAYVITETVFEGRRHHLTEKTFKPICLGMPFVMVSTAGSLKYLRSYGFETFDSIWDESYDLETDDDKRLVMIADLLKQIDSIKDKQMLFDATIDIIEHNYNHFYNGGFERILWDELSSMLDNISSDFND